MAHWLEMPYVGWHHYLDNAIWLDFRRPDDSLQPLIFKAELLDGDFWVLVQRLQTCVREQRKRGRA